MITPDQMQASQALLKSTPSAPPVSGTTQPNGGSWYDKMNAVKLPGVTPQTSATETAPQEPSVADKLQNDISEGTKDYESQPGTAKQLLGPTKTVLRGVGDVAGEVFKPVGKALDMATGGILTKAFSNIANSSPTKGSIIDKITDNPEVQKIVMQHPNAGEDFNRLLNLIFLGEADKAEPDISTSKDIKGNDTGSIIDRTKTQIKNAPETLNKVKETVTQPIKKVVEATKNKIFGKPQEQIQSMTKEWQAPAETPKAGFKRVQAVLEKNPETPQFLAEHGLDPQAHIEKGNYNTSDSADALRQTAGKMSKDGLRPALKTADYETPKTKVSEIKPNASNFHETADDMESVNEKIQSKMAALERKYPDGMSLTQMHDEKITYASKGKYSPIGDPATNINATANRAISSELGDQVASKAPESVPVDAYNAHLQKYYQAADYLDELNGKKAPVSSARNLLKIGMKGAGAIAGAHFGGLPTEIAGYYIGGALEHGLENMPNPVRVEFLKNLKVTNPEAYTKVVKYLGEKQASVLTTPKLEAPAEAGTEKNPHIMRGNVKTEFEAPAEKINRENNQKLLEGKGKNPIQLREESQANKPNSTIKTATNGIESNNNISKSKNQPSYTQIEKVVTSFEKSKDIPTTVSKLKSMFPKIKQGIIEDIIDKSQALTEMGHNASEYIIRRLNKGK